MTPLLSDTSLWPMAAALLGGWVLDLLLADPSWLPHPSVAFGRWIAWGEHLLNRGRCRRLKGWVFALSSIGLAFVLSWLVLAVVPGWASAVLATVLVFFCLAGHTLRREVRDVFRALNVSLDAGRRQVSRIVGRDTAALSAQEVRTAALETLAENLSDGVVAPLFWLALLGVPGMVAYKMVNTLDSMIGYRTERYARFGCVVARADDVANFLPARLTALLMLAADACLRLAAPRRHAAGRGGSFGSRLRFVWHYGPCHASPNSGWPEAALAACLQCRFGGTHDYFGQAVAKPYIGHDPRPLTAADLRTSLHISLLAEVLAVGLTAAALLCWGCNA